MPSKCWLAECCINQLLDHMLQLLSFNCAAFAKRILQQHGHMLYSQGESPANRGRVARACSSLQSAVSGHAFVISRMCPDCLYGVAITKYETQKAASASSWQDAFLSIQLLG